MRRIGKDGDWSQEHRFDVGNRDAVFLAFATIAEVPFKAGENRAHRLLRTYVHTNVNHNTRPEYRIGPPSRALQRRRQLLRLIGQHGRIFFHARGRLERHALFARDDVDVEVKHHLTAGGFV